MMISQMSAQASPANSTDLNVECRVLSVEWSAMPITTLNIPHSNPWNNVGKA